MIHPNQLDNGEIFGDPSCHSVVNLPASCPPYAQASCAGSSTFHTYTGQPVEEVKQN